MPPQGRDIFGLNFLSRKPAWHRTTEPIGDLDITAAEALARMGGDWDIDKWPLLAQDPDTGQLVRTGRYGLFRQAAQGRPREYLGEVGEDYTYAQNRDIARVLDGIAGGTGWRLETMGLIGRGETMFGTLDAGDGRIGGQTSRMYYLINENRGNGRALRLAFTPVIVICANTLEAGLASALVNIGLSHGSDFLRQLDWRAEVVARMRVAQEKTVERLDALVLTRVVEDQLQGILERVYPDPKPNRSVAAVEELRAAGLADDIPLDLLFTVDDTARRVEGQRERAAVLRAAATERFHVYNDEQAEDPRSRGTAFAVLMAVTETEDYRRWGKEEAAGASMLWGERAANKARAMQVLSSLN